MRSRSRGSAGGSVVTSEERVEDVEEMGFATSNWCFWNEKIEGEKSSCSNNTYPFFFRFWMDDNTLPFVVFPLKASRASNTQRRALRFVSDQRDASVWLKGCCSFFWLEYESSAAHYILHKATSRTYIFRLHILPGLTLNTETHYAPFQVHDFILYFSFPL